MSEQLDKYITDEAIQIVRLARTFTDDDELQQMVLKVLTAVWDEAISHVVHTYLDESEADHD